MVRMDFPATSLTESWQERRGVPFSRTVQAPHWPSPQPYFVPVRPSSSRRAKSKVVSGLETKIRPFPLICVWMGPAIGPRSAARLPAWCKFILRLGENEHKSRQRGCAALLACEAMPGTDTSVSNAITMFGFLLRCAALDEDHAIVLRGPVVDNLFYLQSRAS